MAGGGKDAAFAKALKAALANDKAKEEGGKRTVTAVTADTPRPARLGVGEWLVPTQSQPCVADTLTHHTTHTRLSPPPSAPPSLRFLPRPLLTLVIKSIVRCSSTGCV